MSRTRSARNNSRLSIDDRGLRDDWHALAQTGAVAGEGVAELASDLHRDRSVGLAPKWGGIEGDDGLGLVERAVELARVEPVARIEGGLDRPHDFDRGGRKERLDGITPEAPTVFSPQHPAIGGHQGTTSRASTWRWARPWTNEPLPAASVEIIPPTVARLRVEVWEAQHKPSGASKALSLAVTMPGSTTAVRALASTVTSWFKWRLTSITSPLVRLWPLVPVPPPRATMGRGAVAVIRT